MSVIPIVKGDKAREAIDALRGYSYQLYQSALAWIELGAEEFLFLEVAEDYAIAAANALSAVQVKATEQNVTINSDDIVASIDSFVRLRQENSHLEVRLRHLTTSRIGKEKSQEHRIGDTPTLEAWRKLARTGDLSSLRKILEASKLSEQTKKYLRELNETQLREEVLQRIHFDCGALDSTFIVRQLRAKLLELVLARGGVSSQVENCLNSMVMTLLNKATQKSERFVDRLLLEKLVEKTTQIPVNRAQFELQSKLITQALSASIPQNTNLVPTRLIERRPTVELAIPAKRAGRTLQINNIVSSLTLYGVSWIYGAAGVGKTVAAKIAARQVGGIWAGINLRGLAPDQVNAVLSSAISRLSEQHTDIILIDDLECSNDPQVIDLILYLLAICARADQLLIITCSRSPDHDFLFSANLPMTIGQKLEEFSELDIKEILDELHVESSNWIKYIHFVSGGGHPQLTVAAINSMQNREWDISELRNLTSLLEGDDAVEQVRARTRERLLNELPEGGRRLLERLSLKPYSFRRSFVLDIAQITPAVPDGGIVFDQLIGTWVDQHERDRFALSPLLSNLAANTLTQAQKKEINFEIADLLIKGKTLDPIDANSALFAALAGDNKNVVVHLCMFILGAEQPDLKMIAPHLTMFTLMRSDISVFPDDPAVSQIFRGTQLILTCLDKNSENKVNELLECFEAETNRVGDDVRSKSLAMLIYARLLLSEPKFGAIPYFWKLVYKLDTLLENQREFLPFELSGDNILQEVNGYPVVGFMFLYQIRQVKLIVDLLPVFEFLNSCKPELRQKLLSPFGPSEFDLDMFLQGAWLSEHDANTIDPVKHSNVFVQLEALSASWRSTDLAVCCRKYHAIILDEYGGDKNKALEILDEALEYYGETNSEIMRAKARILYRANDYQGSLELSKLLIEGDAPLSHVEKAFLGRDAAISAWQQQDYITAKKYFMYGSIAAGKCDHSDMTVMSVGLRGDAALASWRSEDRETCLRELVHILLDLNNIDPQRSLRAAHCHAACRHVLWWLKQDAINQQSSLARNEASEIYPGIVSNPEPSPEVGQQPLPPIGMAWYLLACVENESILDVGITQRLSTFLLKGPIVEGQILLASSKMRKALTLLDASQFLVTLEETIAAYSYCKEQFESKDAADSDFTATFQALPASTLSQQLEFSALTEQLTLCFILNCIFSKNSINLNYIADVLEESHGFKVRPAFLDCLRGCGSPNDGILQLTLLSAIHIGATNADQALPPMHVFELAYSALQLARQVDKMQIVSKFVFQWLSAKWDFMSKNQRFMLRSPTVFDRSINELCKAESGSWSDKATDLLLAILPLIGYKNEGQVVEAIMKLRVTI